MRTRTAKDARIWDFARGRYIATPCDSNLSPIFQAREAWLLFEVKLDVKLSKLILGDQRWRVK